MSLSDIKWHELDLYHDDRDRSMTSEELKGVLAFGEPVVHDSLRLAKAAGENPDAEMELLKKDHRFTYVRLALSIRPRDGLTIRLVALDLALDGNAVCWSMEPMKVEQEFKSKTQAKISSKLKVKLAEIGSEITEGLEYVIYQPIVEAFNLMRADPAWELTPADGKQLSGIQLFHLVVQAPKVGECRARVSLRADIRQRGFLFSYKARHPEKKEYLATIVL